MKKIWILLAATALLLAGCGSPDRHPEWDEAWTRFGDLIAAEEPADFSPHEYSDALSPSGIWYASWISGEERIVKDADGEDAAAYGAQIYLLVRECGGAEAAESYVADWTAREAEYYGTDGPTAGAVGGRSYSFLILKTARADNPYSHGAAAFGAQGELAVSVEVLCAEGFEGDPQDILERFLSGIHYGE